MRCSCRRLECAPGAGLGPAWPDPPIPGSFTGSVLHAHSYVDPGEPVDMRGKRVVVVGMGNSAMDLACELCQPGVAARLDLSARRGAWVVPNYLFGRPLDQLGLTHPLVPAGAEPGGGRSSCGRWSVPRGGSACPPSLWRLGAANFINH